MDMRTGEYLPDGESFYDESFDDEDDDDDDETAADTSWLDQFPEDELAALMERVTPIVIELESQTKTWLAARDATPSDQLVEAWRSLLLSRLISAAVLPDGPKSEMREMHLDLLDEFYDRIELPCIPEYVLAVKQLDEYIQTDPSVIHRALFKNHQHNAADQGG